jgi:hypothetical protein
MSASNDLDKFFSALQRHKDLIIESHLDNNGFVDESADDDKAITELIRLGVFWRMDDDAARARLSQSFTDVLNLARRDELRRQVNLDIGERLTNLEQQIASYRKARRFGTVEEQDHALRIVEEQVYGLREALSGASRQLWKEIESEFAYVTTLELKLQENQRVIDKVKRLNANLGLLDYETLSGERFAGTDPRLRRLFTSAFVQQIAHIREELVDALHRLDAMLFAFRIQQRQGRIVRAFVLKYQREPGFTPSNYAAQTQIPPILNQVETIPLSGHADLDSNKDEILLTRLIQHLRKQPQRGGAETESERIGVRDTDGVAEEQVELDALNQAVQDFYLRVAEQGMIEAMASFDLAPGDCPADIWLFAIASRHNMMSADEHAVFSLEFIDTPDPFFTGQRSVSDIRVQLR